MSDLIKREDAIEAVLLALDRGDILDIISSLPSAEPQVELISREDAIEAVASADATDGTVKVFTGRQVNGILSALPSAETHDKRTETHGVCLDIIRREDAIAYIDRVTNSGLGRRKSLEYIRKYIVELPSAGAVQGEWIFNPKDAIELMFTKPKCPECGFESSDGGNYCPNCGARMKGGIRNIIPISL